MKLIVGLGNPGAAYRNTRHNVGYEVLDRLAERSGSAFTKEKYKGAYLESAVAGRTVALLKPLTYMNRSGESVALAVRRKMNEYSQILVIYDEVELPLGRIRIRESGSGGTHNGMGSVIAALGTQDIPRMRMGIGPNTRPGDLSSFVLGKFLPEERAVVAEMVERGADAVELAVREGLSVAMNEYNRSEAG